MMPVMHIQDMKFYTNFKIALKQILPHLTLVAMTCSPLGMPILCLFSLFLMDNNLFKWSLVI